MHTFIILYKYIDLNKRVSLYSQCRRPPTKWEVKLTLRGPYEVMDAFVWRMQYHAPKVYQLA